MLSIQSYFRFDRTLCPQCFGILTSCVFIITFIPLNHKNQVGTTAQPTSQLQLILSLLLGHIWVIIPNSRVPAGCYLASALATTSMQAHQINAFHIPGQAEALYPSPVCTSGNSQLKQFTFVLQCSPCKLFQQS